MEQNIQPKFSAFEISDLWERLAVMTPGAHGTYDYGTGEEYTALEVHLVSYIADHPNYTSSEIARDWNRTRGAISQIIQKLRKNGLVFGKPDPNNAKRILLFLTPKGKLLDAKHRETDESVWKGFLESLRAQYSQQQIDQTFTVLQSLYACMHAQFDTIEKDG